MSSPSRFTRPYLPVAQSCPWEERAPAIVLRPHTVLVLGGGGMKGMAHVGVIRALEASHIRVDAIVGTSIGALVGARLAIGGISDELEIEALAVTERAVLKRNVRAFLLGGIAQAGLYDGEHYRTLVSRVLDGYSFASLGIPVRMNALSLCDGRERWFGAGADRSLTLVDAVYASGALPLIFPPLETTDGDVLVDGGLRTMVGVDEAIRWGANRVIAVDVSDIIDPDERDWRRMGLAGIHARVVQVMAEPQRAATMAIRPVPVLHVRPAIGSISSFTFSATPELIDAGESAARRALASPAAAAFHASGPSETPRIRRVARGA